MLLGAGDPAARRLDTPAWGNLTAALRVKRPHGQDQHQPGKARARAFSLAQEPQTLNHWLCSLFAFKNDNELGPAAGMDWHIKAQASLWYHQSNALRRHFANTFTHSFGYREQCGQNLQRCGVTRFGAGHEPQRFMGKWCPKAFWAAVLSP